MNIHINQDGYFETDLYKKKTAKVQYLLPSSCHPNHISQNIPYSLAYRLLRICSDEENFKRRLEELRQDLLLRCYKPKIIHDAFERVLKIDRKEALKKVSKIEGEKTTMFVANYHPSLPSISKTLKKHYDVMIQNCPEMKDCFKRPSIVAYRRCKISEIY